MTKHELAKQVAADSGLSGELVAGRDVAIAGSASVRARNVAYVSGRRREDRVRLRGARRNLAGGGLLLPQCLSAPGDCCPSPPPC